MASIRICLCGDLMTGRGIDQVLPHPGDPTLHEPCVRDAREYVKLAVDANGPIPQPVDFAHVWGDARKEILRSDTDVRIANLETSVTRSNDYWPGKEIHYRMHPDNVGCLTAAGFDCYCLANNHVIDWGFAGLEETLATLDEAGLGRAGAGRNAAEAAAPAVLDVPGKGRVLVASVGSTTSGIPEEWQAGEGQPGVFLLPDLSPATAETVARQVANGRQGGDMAVVSIHWGGNFGYHVPQDQIEFAHRLIESGIDIVHGHSSHHPKAIEIYRGRPILYGCGDFLNDYEGIRGYEHYRGDLTLLYIIDLADDGRLMQAHLVPFHIRQFRLGRASMEETDWLRHLFNEQGTRFGTGVERQDAACLELHWH